MCFVLLSSCDKSFMSKPLPEVDFSKPINVQLTYIQDIYNIKLLYDSGKLTITLCDTDSTLDEMIYTINSDICQISYKGITHDVSVVNLPETSLPLVIYKFISDFGGVVPTESYDSQNLCYYISRNILDSQVNLEVFENDEKVVYALYIT